MLLNELDDRARLRRWYAFLTLVVTGEGAESMLQTLPAQFSAFAVSSLLFPSFLGTKEISEETILHAPWRGCSTDTVWGCSRHLTDKLFGMARKTVITLEDDLDGSEASETVQFAIDGAEYEIDLNEEHANELRQALGRFADAARKSSGGRGRSVGRRPSSRSSDAKAIRQWALDKGLKVNTRGRIQADIVEQYRPPTENLRILIDRLLVGPTGGNTE